MVGTPLIAWTIRLSLVGFAIVLAAALGAPAAFRSAPRFWRGLWTLSCLLFVAHVVCAFQFFHHWSHQHALEDTARQTQELLGWAFGEGLYFSYLFLVLWVGDVLWWWIAEDSYWKRPAWVGGIVYGYLLFIAANGAIVFKTGATRYAGLVALGALGGLLARRLLTGEPSAPDETDPFVRREKAGHAPDYLGTSSGRSDPSLR